MKYILLLLLLPFLVKAQSDDTTKYTKYPNTYGLQYARLWATKVLRIPTDTNSTKTGIAQIGITLYVGDGIKWSTISGGGATDTTSLSNRINARVKYADSGLYYITPTTASQYATASSVNSALALKLNLGDTSSMLSFYLRKSDTLRYNTALNGKVKYTDSTIYYVTPTQLSSASYTLPQATSSVLGGVKIGSNISVSSGTISINNSNVIAALGYMPIQLSSLSATRSVSSGSVFTYNNLTGAYNLDTTRLGQTYTANAPISIVANVIKADTSTRFTGIATIGKAYNDSLVLASATNLRVKYTDTTSMLTPYLRSNVAAATYQPILTAGSNITITSNTIAADTSTGSTKLATQGFVSRGYAGLNSVNTFNTTNYFKGMYANKDSIPIVTSKTWGLILDTVTGQFSRQSVGTGTITSVATGFGLSGGTITTTGTLLVDSSKVPTVTQVVSPIITLTDGATVIWDARNGCNAQVTLAGTGRTLTVTNAVAGRTYHLDVYQDGTGSRTITTYTNFISPAGVIPSLTTTASARDEICMFYDGTKFTGVWLLNCK
jgi:hypothetical protein